MDYGDKLNVGHGSMDLYSRVKLRALTTREARAAKKNDFPVAVGKFSKARLRKCKSNVRKRSSLDSMIDVENQAREDANAVKTSGLRSLVAATVEEIDEWNNTRKDLSIQRYNAYEFDDSNHLLDEGTAIEMLGQLSEGRTENRCNQFDIGDLVWGKITSYPWWPGQIYNEALASPSVRSIKKEGSVLVAFFGDYTYAWLDPRHLIPFDIHYAAKSRQTSYSVFKEAVEEAVREFKRRAVLGLICHCQNPSNFLPIKVGGLFEVDFNGFIPGGIFSAEQIKKARDDFQPEETFAFLKQMALTPRNFAPDNLSWLKTMLKVQFYQRKTLCYFKSYVQDNQVVQQRSCQNPKSSAVDKAALLGVLEAKAREIQVSKQDPVRQKNIKYLTGISGNQSYLELHGEKGTGIETRSSIELVKESVTESSSTENKVEPDQPLMLVMNFPPGVVLPSVLELKDKFTPFGPLQESSISVLWESSRCEIVFQRITDAAEAYLHAIQNRSLFRSPVRYDLEAVGVAGSELPELSKSYPSTMGECNTEIQPEISLTRTDYLGDIKQTVHQLLAPEKFKREPCVEGPSFASISSIPILETVKEGHMEIQPAPLLSRAEYFNDLKPTVSGFLPPEEIKREPCVKRPRFGTAGAIPFLASNSSDAETSQHIIPVESQCTSLCHTPQPFHFSQNYNDIDKKYDQLEAMKSNDSRTIHTSTSASDTEKNFKFINPLHSYSDVLGGIKPFI